MTPLTVGIPVEVQDQIREQVAYIAQRSPLNAVRWELRLRAAILALGDTTFHTPDRTATSRLGREICKVVFERTYLIYYEVDLARGHVELVHFRHGMREPRPGEP